MLLIIFVLIIYLQDKLMINQSTPQRSFEEAAHAVASYLAMTEIMRYNRQFKWFMPYTGVTVKVNMYLFSQTDQFIAMAELHQLEY